jgi:hypothetical protein
MILPPPHHLLSIELSPVKIHRQRAPWLRRLNVVCACLAAAACSGDGGTGAAGLKVQIDLPGRMDGVWASPGQILNCRPLMTVTATGQGRAAWTGGTSRFTAPYGSYDFTYTADEVTQMVGAPAIAAGETITAVLPRSGYASFHVQVSFDYTVEGTAQTGTASGGYDCDAPT